MYLINCAINIQDSLPNADIPSLMARIQVVEVFPGASFGQKPCMSTGCLTVSCKNKVMKLCGEPPNKDICFPSKMFN